MGNTTSADGTTQWDVNNAPIELVLQVLSHATWADRLAVFGTSQRMHSMLGDDATWRWMSKMLAKDDQVYVPSECVLGDNWKDMFMALWSKRARWQGGGGGEDLTFQTKVVVRFRPARHDPTGARGELKVTVPLHQRLQMIKMAHKCSDAQARKLLWGKARDGVDHWGSAAVTEVAEKENVPAGAGAPQPDDPAITAALATLVPARADAANAAETHAAPPPAPATAATPATTRPSDGEGAEGGGGGGGGAAGAAAAAAAAAAATLTAASASPEKEGMALPASAKAGILAVRPNEVFLCAPSCGIRQFKTDCALASDTTQRDVYRKSAAPVVCDWLNGINGCLFVFGQTGSGKTHTMFGPDEDSAATLSYDHAVNPQRGLVPRVLAEALAHVESQTAAGADVKLQLSYVEVYGDEVTDLLREGGNVGAWKGVAAKTVLTGRIAMPVHNAVELETMLRDADKSKRRAATAMNERSSRAHAVIVLQLTQVKRGGQEITSQLCLADLGGSEQLKRSKAEGQQLEEAVKINLGLLSLKQCMEALNRGASHVPYQSSMLTSILQGALGGTSRTCVVVTGSMDPLDTNETMHALRFGEVCGAVENKASLSVNSSAAAVAAMDTQLKELLARIQTEEKWVSFKVERDDLDGKEVVMQSKLVGAEGIREEYEALLQTRAALLGI